MRCFYELLAMGILFYSGCNSVVVGDETCGNNILEEDELCDIGIQSGLGACPTPSDCDDGLACTGDALEGKRCLAHCTHTIIQEAISGDGCCPMGATFATDQDCSSDCGDGSCSGLETCRTCPTDCGECCGNGHLDDGEACDTAIISGPGACETAQSCVNNNPCEIAELNGSGCQVVCHRTAINEPHDDDGCCPAGATAQSDNDCSSGCGDEECIGSETCLTCPTDCGECCGNGQMDDGEVCDTAIVSGPGVCETAQSCISANPCEIVQLNGNSCQVVCNRTVISEPRNDDGCCPVGVTAQNDNDCAVACQDNFECASGVCSQEGCILRSECVGNPASQVGAACSNDSVCSSYLDCQGEIPFVADGYCFEPCTQSTQGGGYQSCCTSGNFCGDLYFNLSTHRVCCEPGQVYSMGAFTAECSLAAGLYLCNRDADCPQSWGLSACKKDGSNLGQCVQCLGDEYCFGGDVCHLEKCVDCNDSSQCARFWDKPVCLDHVCVACIEDNQCQNDQRLVCIDNHCEQCRSGADCPSDQPYCGTFYRCAQCLDDNHCSDPLPHCNGGTCAQCGDSSDCPTQNPICYGGSCVECTWHDDCPVGNVCNPDTNRCQLCEGCQGLCEVCEDAVQCEAGLHCGPNEFGEGYRCRNSCFLFCEDSPPQAPYCNNNMFCACTADG